MSEVTRTSSTETTSTPSPRASNPVVPVYPNTPVVPVYPNTPVVPVYPNTPAGPQAVQGYPNPPAGQPGYPNSANPAVPNSANPAVPGYPNPAVPGYPNPAAPGVPGVPYSEAPPPAASPRTQYSEPNLAQHAAKDPEKPVNTNALRYAFTGESNRDHYIVNLSGEDCIARYGAMKTSKALDGKAVRFCFVIVGGKIEGINPDGTPRSVSGARRIAGWSQDGGAADQANWQSQLWRPAQAASTVNGAYPYGANRDGINPATGHPYGATNPATNQPWHPLPDSPNGAGNLATDRAYPTSPLVGTPIV